MPHKFPKLEDLRKAYRARTAAGYDNYTLCTGDVGNWKSLWLRKFGASVSRRPLSVDNIHFTFEDWIQDFVKLQPGDTIIRDEWKAHKRQAMHGFRLEELDTNKEGRQIGANAFFAYPDAGEVDGDLLKRFNWWHDKPSREFVVVREIKKKLMFDRQGKPFTDVKWPIVGAYPLTGDNDPLRWPYEAKKEARMRDRNAKFLEDYAGEEVRKEAKPLINPSILAMVQAELKK